VCLAGERGERKRGGIVGGLRRERRECEIWGKRERELDGESLSQISFIIFFFRK